MSDNLESAYENACKAACQWCAKGDKIDIDRKRRNEDGKDEKTRMYRAAPVPEPPQHIAGYTDYSTFNVPNRWNACTAPTPEAFMEAQDALIASQAAEIERSRRLLGEITPCRNCDGSGKNTHGDCCRIPGHSKDCKCTLCQWKNASQRQAAQIATLTNTRDTQSALIQSMREALEAAHKKLYAISYGHSMPQSCTPENWQHTFDIAFEGMEESRAALAQVSASPPFHPLDCTCDSDPLGRCVVHGASPKEEQP